jgi:hypothetical protein
MHESSVMQDTASIRRLLNEHGRFRKQKHAHLHEQQDGRRLEQRLYALCQCLSAACWRCCNAILLYDRALCNGSHDM